MLGQNNWQNYIKDAQNIAEVNARNEFAKDIYNEYTYQQIYGTSVLNSISKNMAEQT